MLNKLLFNTTFLFFILHQKLIAQYGLRDNYLMGIKKDFTCTCKKNRNFMVRCILAPINDSAFDFRFGFYSSTDFEGISGSYLLISKKGWYYVHQNYNINIKIFDFKSKVGDTTKVNISLWGYSISNSILISKRLVGNKYKISGSNFTISHGYPKLESITIRGKKIINFQLKSDDSLVYYCNLPFVGIFKRFRKKVY